MQALAELVDQSLLLWDAEGGVKMHDVVRDFSRARTGTETLRRHQRALVQLLLSPEVSPRARWKTSGLGPLSLYVCQAFKVHVAEAVLEDTKEDAAATEWLSYAPANELVNDFVSLVVTSALGHDALTFFASEAESRADLWQAARLMFSAAIARSHSDVHEAKKMQYATIAILQRYTTTLNVTPSHHATTYPDEVHPDLLMVTLISCIFSTWSPGDQAKLGGEVTRLESSQAVQNTHDFLPWVTLRFITHMTPLLLKGDQPQMAKYLYNFQA